MTVWTKERVDEMRRHWNAGLSMGQIAKRMGTTRGSIDGASRRANLHFRPGVPMTLAPSHPAARAGHTIFPTRVAHDTRPLKPGSYSRKLGAIVEKGAWRGMPIYTLALEERATCPRSCARWLDCYGNHMQAAKRQSTLGLIGVLASQLGDLSRDHPGGFVVRLHVLGDFYSVEYVEQWARWLRHFPALRVFGYTAWRPATPIGKRIGELRDAHWDRFAIRTSAGNEEPRAIVVDAAEQAGDAILCPVQTGKTASCGTCSLCWSTRRDIAFLRH